MPDELMAHFGAYQPDSGWTFYHGTPDIRAWEHGAHYGIHVGTREAAKTALEAKIGKPHEGEWDGTREYGKTLLNNDQVSHQFHPETRTFTRHVTHVEPSYPSGRATYSDGTTPVPMDARPHIFPVRITGPMTNHPATPHGDWHANGYMQAQIKRGRAKSGYFYRNISEDEGSISAVVPSAAHLERLDVPKTAGLLEHMAAWYHGTSAELEPGAMVEPDRPSHYQPEPEGYAFFTDSPDRARHYADTALAREPYEAGKDARVYQVEPTGPHFSVDPRGGLQADDRKSVYPLRVVREANLLEHFGVLAEPFANPYHGTEQFGGRPEFSRTWFHGTRGTSPEFHEQYREGNTGSEPRMSQSPGERAMHSGWPQPNKLVGVHFSPLHRVAHRFATGIYPTKPDPERGREGSPGTPSAIVHAHLRMSNPVHYPTEDHLNLAMAQYADKHYAGWHDDKLNANLQWQYSDRKGTRRNWHEEHLPGGEPNPHGLSDDELAERNWGEADPKEPRYLKRVAGHAQQVLQWHPHLPEIIEGFKGHLESQGHHGITYGNEVEGPGQGGHDGEYDKEFADHTYQDVRHISAIATRPSQIETARVEHIAPPKTEPEAHEVEHHPPDSRFADEDQTWQSGKHGYASDANEPKDMYDRVGAFHAQHGGAYPGLGKEAKLDWLKSEFADEPEEPDERESEDWSQGWPGFPHEKKRRKKTAAYYHGTHLDLQPGDTVEPGHPKNWGYSKPEHLYLSTNPWGAGGYGDVSAYRHGMGTGKGRTYEVEPTGPVESDENSRGHADYEENRVTAHPARVIREVPREEARQISMRKRGSAPAYDGPWYHGTAHRFKPGALIEPGYHKAHDVSSPEHVYLAASEPVARTFGGLAAVRNKARTYSIYQVEPTGPTEPDPDGMGHRSRHPLRVVRLHERGASPEDPNPWWNQPGTGKGYPKQAAVPGRAFDADAEPGPFAPGEHPGPFLHGGPNRVEPGDVIRQDAMPASHGRLKHSYFTTSRDVAEDAADMRNGRGHGWIHTIEPTDSYERDYGEPDSFRSRAPLRVLSVEPGRLNGSTPHPPVLREARIIDMASSSGDRHVTCARGHEHWGAYGAAGLLIRHRGEDGRQRYLLQKRGPYVNEPDTWSVPGGAIGRHESPEQGAWREAREEMGSIPAHVKTHHTVTSTDCGDWQYHTVVADAGEHFMPRGGGSTQHETAGVGWHTADEIDDLRDSGDLHPGFAKSWDAVRRSRGPKTAVHEDSEGSLYLRFGDWHPSETSRNYVTGHPEFGVSVYDLDHRGNPEDPDPRWERGDADDPDDEYGNDTGEELRGRVRRAERDRYHGEDRGANTGHLVRGKMVGIGHDNEPLLKDVRRVGDWIDHRHLFIPGAEKHRLARDEHDEDYEPPEEASPHTAVITPGSLPPEQQSAFDVEDLRAHRSQMLDVAKNPPPGTRVWRGEMRNVNEHPADAASTGMHWSVNPDSIIGFHKGGDDVRRVVWQGVVENHAEQAFPRSHPMWRGKHESYGHEAEVRFRPGARVKLEGAYTDDSGSPGYLVPHIPERTSPGWKWHPLDRHIEIRHAGHGAADYSELGIPREAGRQLPVSEIGPLYHGTTAERAGRILENGFEGGTVHLTPHADLAGRYAAGRVIKDKGGTPAVLKIDTVRGVSGHETGYMDPEMSRRSGADYQDKGPEVVVLNPAAIHGISRHAAAEPAMVP